MLASAIRSSSNQKTRFINSKQLAKHTANYSGLERADIEQFNRNSSKRNQQEQFTFVVTKEIPLNSKQLQSASNANWNIIQSELQSICASNEYKLIQAPDIILLDKEWIKGRTVQKNSPPNVNRNIHV